jgi:thiol-disulfide isomerase/thioredoxin
MLRLRSIGVSVVAATAIASLSVAAPDASDPASSKIGIAPVPDEPKGVPPVFTDMVFKDALDQNKASDKLLVVKFTAEWCGPCKLMDRTTWRDQNVVAWAKDNAVVLQVDVDKQREVSMEYGVRAMPTMIAFKKGEAVDRVIGYRDGAAILAWMDNVKNGRTEIGRLEDAAKNAKDDTPIRTRLDTARGLMNGGKLEAATNEYLWLWANMAKKEPSMSGVRVSFTLGEIADLCSQHAPALEAFTKLRDDAEVRLKGDNKSWDDLGDWLCLNEAVKEEEKTLAWFDRIKNDADAKQTLERFSYRLQPLLEQRERWADVGRLIPDPIQKLKDDYGIMRMSSVGQGMDAALKAQVQAMAKDNFRRRSSSLYAGLLAAGRFGDAQRFVTEATRLDDTAQMRVALVKKAVDLGQTNTSQTRLLDEAEKVAGEDKELLAEISGLREKLKTATSRDAG